MGVASEKSPSSTAGDGQTLSARDQHILEFERQWWKHAGAKEEAIRGEFGLSASRYYQVLNSALDLPAALVFDPMLVKRLRRVRDARMTARAVHSGAHSPEQP